MNDSSRSSAPTDRTGAADEPRRGVARAPTVWENNARENRVGTRVRRVFRFGESCRSSPALRSHDYPGKAHGLVVIDEVQRRPDLFESVRVLVDWSENSARFLLLGSASPQLVRGVSESLAGRLAFADLGGFDLQELGPEQWERLLAQGRLSAIVSRAGRRIKPSLAGEFRSDLPGKRYSAAGNHDSK